MSNIVLAKLRDLAFLSQQEKKSKILLFGLGELLF